MTDAAAPIAPAQPQPATVELPLYQWRVTTQGGKSSRHFVAAIANVNERGDLVVANPAPNGQAQLLAVYAAGHWDRVENVDLVARSDEIISARDASERRLRDLSGK